MDTPEIELKHIDNERNDLLDILKGVQTRIAELNLQRENLLMSQEV
jgi:hypothetical protein